jgi:hypothetical protein
MEVENPDSLPDIASCDFLLFPSMKNALKGSQLETLEKNQEVMVTIPNILQENYFWKRFDVSKQRWKSCTAAEGNYTEDHCSSE